MKEPLVSVVMVTCNVERFLKEAIESVLSQSLRDFEFVIVDFGSTDKSKEIISSYALKDRRINFSEIPNCGLATARNAACFLAKGRYLAIQDADDISLPDRLIAEVEFMEKHPEVGLVGSAIQRIDSDGKFLTTVNDYPTEDHDIRLKLKEWNTFWQPTVLMLREAFLHAGGYLELLPPSEDYDLWLRISEHYKCANLRQVLVYYRIHSYQASVRQRKRQILCALAAQAAARLRQQGKTDPLLSATDITPALLVAMGVSEIEQENAVAEGFVSVMKNIYMAGGHAAIPEIASEMFRLCKSKGVNKRYIYNAHILSAKAYWKQRRVFSSFLSLGRAVSTRPRSVGRPLKPLLRLFGSF
jgi:hypothetical protein